MWKKFLQKNAVFSDKTFLNWNCKQKISWNDGITRDFKSCQSLLNWASEVDKNGTLLLPKKVIIVTILFFPTKSAWL